MCRRNQTVLLYVMIHPVADILTSRREYLSIHQLAMYSIHCKPLCEKDILFCLPSSSILSCQFNSGKVKWRDGCSSFF